MNRIATISCHRCGRSQGDCKEKYSAQSIHVKFETYKAEKERIAEEKRQKEEAAKEERRRQARKEQEERWKRQEEWERTHKEEEARRLEQERIKAEKRKKVLLGLLAAAVIASTACCYIFVLRPLLQYNKGKNLLSEGKYSEAKEIFGGLGGYKDSAELEITAEAENILYEADSLYLAGDLDAACNLYAQLNSNSFSEDYRKAGRDKQNDVRYQQAAALVEDGNYSEALGIYVTLGYYKDSNDLRIKTEYKLAEQYLNEGNYKAAYDYYLNLGDYKDSIENAALAGFKIGEQLYENRQYEKASEILRESLNYKDAEKLYYKTIYQRVNPGDMVLFGVYKTVYDSVAAPVEWKVIDKDNGCILLISAECMCQMQYSDIPGATSYKDSLVRNWCNDTFYDSCFSVDEKRHILKTTLEEGMEDRIFIPSILDIDQYSINWGFHSVDYVGCWTRTPCGNNRIYILSSSGEVFRGTGTLPEDEKLVRPMIWVDCSSNVEISKDATSETVIRIVDTEAMKETEKKVQSSSSSSSTRKSSGSSSKTYSGSSSSSSSSSGYGYDANDPYYSAADHDGDGKLTDDEFQEAMGNAIDDLLAGTYQGG